MCVNDTNSDKYCTLTVFLIPRPVVNMLLKIPIQKKFMALIANKWLVMIMLKLG